jgi:low temperature requirement protein LtrA
VLARVVAARPWQGAVVADFPIVQGTFGITPWIVSLWIEPPWKYVLWAVGLAIDLVYLLVASRDRLIAGGQQRVDQNVERFTERAAQHGVEVERHDGDDELTIVATPELQQNPRVARHGLPTVRTTIQTVSADLPHLGERFGLFVLIVIGEGLVQIIDGASEATWNRPLLMTGLGAFVVVTVLWTLAVRRGYAGVSLLPDSGMPVRDAWVAHLVSTGALATMAAVIGRLVAEPRADVPTHDIVVIAVAYLVHGVGSALVHVVRAGRLAGALRRDALRSAAALGLSTAAAGSLVLGFEHLSAEGVVWILAGGLFVAYAAATRWEPGRARAATAEPSR